MTTTANYAAMVESYKSLMALGVANFYNLSVSVPGSFTSIGTLNQYPQVQSALTDPGAFAPYVWDAVVAVAVGIKNLQVYACMMVSLSL